MFFSSIVKSTCRSLGFDLIRWSPDKRMGLDPFYAQQSLMRDTPPQTIFDLGANTGQTAATYRRLFPQATIYSFEPFDAAFAELAAAFAGDSFVRPHKLALCDEIGQRTFFTNRDNTTNSLLASTLAGRELVHGDVLTPVGRLQVQTSTVDEFCHANNIPSIDILKLDIQGGELMAIRGAKSMLSRQAVSLIYSELLFAPLYDSQAEFIDIIANLRDAGYRLFGLYELHSLRGRGLTWGDAIFLSGELDRKIRQSA